mmetsp:Transcript_25608/g.73609  ORF Transcript_25608/g.73609 Transcript_25608/m.73609 type:complete len:113 (-) Transcript_25608:1715-2053(-)
MHHHCIQRRIQATRSKNAFLHKVFTAGEDAHDTTSLGLDARVIEMKTHCIYRRLQPTCDDNPFPADAVSREAVQRLTALALDCGFPAMFLQRRLHCACVKTSLPRGHVKTTS